MLSKRSMTACLLSSYLQIEVKRMGNGSTLCVADDVSSAGQIS